MTLSKHTIRNQIMRLGLTSLALFGLAACNQTTANVGGIENIVVRNSVQLVRLPYTIKAEEDGTETPSAHTLEQLNLFLAQNNATYSDKLFFDPASDVSATRLEALANTLRANALSFGGLASLGGKPQAGTIVLYLERHTVTPPNCGNWAPELSNDRRNNPSSFWGCATARNLGLMAADARDLTSGQGDKNATHTAVGAINTSVNSVQSGGPANPQAASSGGQSSVSGN